MSVDLDQCASTCSCQFLPHFNPHAEKLSMSERIDQFCENLRVKLTSIDNNMDSLKAKIDGKARTAEQDVRTHLDGIKKRIEQERTKVSAAQADIKSWVEERKATTSEKIAEWKNKLEIAKLQSRAESAERYAAAAAVVALAAVDEAEQASLEAWLARKDADSAQGTKAA
jgi:predicted  nucleic acid-binding Zn-ribbon protein